MSVSVGVAVVLKCEECDSHVMSLADQMILFRAALSTICHCRLSTRD